MKKLLELIKNCFLRLSRSRGFSPARLILTGIYVYAIIVSAPVFTASIGNYGRQAAALAVFSAGLILFLRSLKKIFDKKARSAILSFLGLTVEKIGRGFEIIGEKIKNVFGIGRFRGYGEERDYVFGERRRKGKKRGRLRNTQRWGDSEDNAARVRFIFTEFMISKIREGYRMKPSETPTDIEREVASADEDHCLFEAYGIARYSGGREQIDDETVERLSEHYGIKK
ncbi:MAG: DUF4129 domain-containing protein [Clostridia bacterium]|nr:DUF4129 domain-containing protein [Clostridia bacterium]